MRINALKIILVLSFLVMYVGCFDDGDNTSGYTGSPGYNIYEKSKTLQEVNKYRQSKDVDILQGYLDDDNILVISETILAIASIADSSNVGVVVPLLKNKNPKIRMYAAYAIGKSFNSVYEEKLFEAYKSETDDYVRQQILIALGKCGTEKALNYIVSLNIDKSKNIILEGQGRAFYYFASRNIISQQMIQLIMNMIDDADVYQTTKITYSYALTTNNNIDLTSYIEIIKTQIKSNANVFLVANLTKSLRHVYNDESIPVLKSIYETAEDYRVKIAAIESLSFFDYTKVKSIMFSALSDTRSTIAELAAKYFLANGNAQDADEYFNISKKIVPWQARTVMFSAALKYSSNKKMIANSIISGYNAVENKYEKAALLYALSVDPSQYKFVKDETFSTDDYVISAAGIKSLFAMRLSENFDRIAKQMQQSSGVDLYTEFKFIFREALSSRSKVMVYYAAKAINIPEFEVVDVYKNTFYLNQALPSFSLPVDNYAWKEMVKAVETYGSDPFDKNPKIDAFVFDWEEINAIKPEQRAIVKTTAGDFEMTLKVNDAPATVGTFLDLALKGYYNNTPFYKEIPGMAIVNGGKRGDGEMNFNISLVNETRPVNFNDGSVAMRLVGGGYQSANWFIATAPAIEYDNNYTIFAEITKGIDVVHNLEVGDKVIEVIVTN